MTATYYHIISSIFPTIYLLRFQSYNHLYAIQCRLSFFGASNEKAYSKQSGWNILLKNVHGNRVMLL